MGGGPITLLLAAARRGDAKALNEVFAELYEDLRRLARLRLRSHEVPTLLDTTALVHESYLRFVKTGHLEVEDRPHFLACAGRVMRSVLVDFVRERAAVRRGGLDIRVPMDTQMGQVVPEVESEVFRVNQALDELALVSERLVRVVEMRYFAGMSEAEIAEVLGVTERTVRRDWEKARVLLASALR
jgi:RNA polymerase sigma factor (TIGR02999 family)